MLKETNILKIFFENPTKEYNVRESARTLKVSPATASKELKKFTEKDILKEKKSRLENLYKANLDNSLYLDMKIFYNITKIKSSGLIEELNKFYLKPTIILFGSCAEGTDIENSDIDLMIVSEKNKEFPQIKKFEKKLNRKIQLFVIKDIKELKNKHLINSILNGISIQGKIKWI